MLEKPSHRRAALPKQTPPILTIVVDTEEEFDWRAPFSRDNTATTSIKYQTRAHEKIFDQFGVIPTYVVDWPVATSQEAITLRSLQDQGQCEIGTHLHPWVTPPYDEVVNHFNSYAGNLPSELEFSKLDALTTAISEKFQRPPRVFKAGRYGLGENTSSSISKLGYLMDASVVPYTSFVGDGGPDFTAFGVDPYWFGPEQEPLLELPVTAGFCGSLRQWGTHIYPALQTEISKSMRLGGISSKLGVLDRIRLSPEGYELEDLKRLTRTLKNDGCQVFSLTYHSPTLEPGHTPYVKSQFELDQFIQRIKEYLEFFKQEIGGVFMSTSQLHALFTAHRNGH